MNIISKCTVWYALKQIYSIRRVLGCIFISIVVSLLQYVFSSNASSATTIGVSTFVLICLGSFFSALSISGKKINITNENIEVIKNGVSRVISKNEIHRIVMDTKSKVIQIQHGKGVPFSSLTFFLEEGQKEEFYNSYSRFII